MKAAQINEYGGPEVLKTVSNASKPKPGTGQVLVEVYAASANPFDWKVREGAVSLNFPATLGGDLAGVVSELGEDVSGFQIGDEVYGQANPAGGQGSFAEFALAKAGSLLPKPANVDFVTAAALPLTSVSAYQALVDNLQLQRGQKILIHGGAGGIGSMAVQLAKHLGAYVATTVATNDIDFAKSLGADEVIDYKTQDFTGLIKDYDAVFDTAGGGIAAKSYQVLKPGGKLVSMSENPDEDLMQRYKISATHQSSHVNAQSLGQISPLVEAGVLKVNIDKIFPLDQAGEALGYLQTGHPRGKVVIQVKP